MASLATVKEISSDDEQRWDLLHDSPKSSEGTLLTAEQLQKIAEEEADKQRVEAYYKFYNVVKGKKEWDEMRKMAENSSPDKIFKEVEKLFLDTIKRTKH